MSDDKTKSRVLMDDTADLLATLIQEAKAGNQPVGQGDNSEGRELWSIGDRLKLVDISTKFIAAKQRIDLDSDEPSRFDGLRNKLNRGRAAAN